VARWDESVQHYRPSLVAQLDCAARLFLCAGCRAQVVLCSRCDRGNRYCSRACWRQTHDLARREAARRYQRSRGGRTHHAARSRRWRERAAVRATQGEDADITANAGSDVAHKVTHQGSHPRVAAAPLAACTLDSASIALAPAVSAQAPLPLTRCWRCAAVQTGWLRQGFLRRGSRVVTRPPGWRHDHSP
jgi:hypothetical protein